MNILVISNCPVVESQGSGYVISNTVKSLQVMGHDVEVVSRESIIIFPKVMHRANIYRMAIGMGLWAFKNKRKIKASDAIITYGGESYFMLYLIKSVFKIKTPVILHSNGLEVHVDQKLKQFKDYLPTVEKKWYHFNTQFLFEYCYRSVDAIITVSDYERDFAVNRLEIDAKKVFTLQPCLPDIFFESSDIVDNKRPIIVFCGSWIVRKGIAAIKEGIPDVLRNNPQYTFRLIGVGHDFRIEAHFPSDVLKQIELFPFVDSKETLIDLYTESDIFLFPSFCESFGLVVAEAMFCRCCVITGPTGIAASLKHGVEAMVLAIPDTVQVVEALNTLIASEGLRNEMRNAARAKVMDLKWHDYAMRLERVLSDVVSKN